jgi:photosystem II stability/assembly factor-like uncharacterized protein
MANRDRSIEQMLRHSLGSDQEAPRHDCPDAETLAALADDALAEHARREAEAHIADCDQCQAVMAAVARAEPLPGQTDGADATDAAAFPWWTRGGALPWIATATTAAATIVMVAWLAIPRRPASPSSASASPSPTEQQMAAAAPPDAAFAPPSTVPRDDLQAAAPLAKDDVRTRQESDAQTPAPAAAESKLAALPAAPTPELFGQVTARNSEAPTTAADAAGARTPGTFDVMSPDPQVRWRVSPGPTVQYSTDGGATWALQQTNISEALAAGSAPARDVCWLVGGAGTVLRTTDGGRRWQRAPFLAAAVLTAVTSSSALDAVVDAADGRRFSTTDGGETWVPRAR